MLQVDCDELFGSEEIDRPSDHPPKQWHEIPKKIQVIIPFVRIYPSPLPSFPVHPFVRLAEPITLRKTCNCKTLSICSFESSDRS